MTAWNVTVYGADPADSRIGDIIGTVYALTNYQALDLAIETHLENVPQLSCPHSCDATEYDHCEGPDGYPDEGLESISETIFCATPEPDTCPFLRVVAVSQRVPA